MPLRSTFEIGTQIILSKIDGFLKGWILNITPLKGLRFFTHKKDSGGASIHRIDELFPLKPSLAHLAKVQLYGIVSIV